MGRAWFLSLMFAAAVGLAAPQAWAKKARLAPADADETEKDDEKPKGKKAPADDAETHKARAKEVAGKDLDKAKTKGQLDKLTGQVGALDKKLKEKGKAPATDEAAPSGKKGKKTPATKPVEEVEKKK